MKINQQAKQDAYDIAIIGGATMGEDNAVGYNYFDEEYGIWEKKMHPVANNEPLIERAII